MQRHRMLDALLAEEELMPCTFSVDAADLGYLDPLAAHQQHLAAGTQVELPLWMTKAIASKQLVQLDVPKKFGLKARDDIMAGPLSVRLSEKSYYYFEVGIALARAAMDSDLLRTLRFAFSGERFRHILDWSLNSRSEDSTNVTQDLTYAEDGIFQAGKNGATECDMWKRGATSVMKASQVLKAAQASGNIAAEGDRSSKRPRV